MGRLVPCEEESLAAMMASGCRRCSGAETPNHLVRNGLAPDVTIHSAAGPDPGLAPLDRELAGERHAVTDVEARATELADLGGDVEKIAKLDRHMKARLHIDQWDPDDVISREQVLAWHAEHTLEHLPGGPVEIFEKAAVEDDAGGIAMAPFDPQALVVDEVGHRVSVAGDAVRARHIVFSALEPADFAWTPRTCSGDLRNARS
jgi:hypothetical protein